VPVIDHLDLATKLIFLAAGVRAYHPVDDLYREVRALRRTDETLRVFPIPLVASGNVAKGGGKFTPRLVTFRNGWRVVPEDTSHVLNVTGEQITDDGQSGPACFDMTPLSATSKVIVQYEPPAAEVIVVETGGGSGETDWTAQERAQILAALDASISSRAAAGAAMALTSNERDALSLRIWDELLSAHSANIGSAGHEMGHIHDALVLKHGTIQAGSTEQYLQTNITGSEGIYIGLTIMVRGATERCARIVRSFDGVTGVFGVTIPFAFLPQAGDSIFVLAQRHAAIHGAVR
jgi:hypothetical protein